MAGQLCGTAVLWGERRDPPGFTRLVTPGWLQQAGHKVLSLAQPRLLIL